jgi:alkylhydroperoxidase family enzyme
MPHIRTISESDATGELAEIYRQLRDPAGRVAHIFKIQSLSPRTLAAHSGLYRELMFGQGGLRRDQRELCAVAVSQANNCHY